MPLYTPVVLVPAKVTVAESVPKYTLCPLALATQSPAVQLNCNGSLNPEPAFVLMCNRQLVSLKRKLGHMQVGHYQHHSKH